MKVGMRIHAPRVTRRWVGARGLEVHEVDAEDGGDVGDEGGQRKDDADDEEHRVARPLTKELTHRKPVYGNRHLEEQRAGGAAEGPTREAQAPVRHWILLPW